MFHLSNAAAAKLRVFERLEMEGEMRSNAAVKHGEEFSKQAAATSARTATRTIPRKLAL